MPDLRSESDSATPQGDATSPDNGRPATPAAGDPLARLYRMSTTAGVGSQEYVAINSAAIAAMILGVASVLVILHPILLVIPAAGFVCGVVALTQIRNSNGTQTGRGLAALGLLLAIGFGAGNAAFDIYSQLRTRSDQRQISDLIQTLSDDLTAGKYDQAYDLFTERFRGRVDAITFTAAFKKVEQMPQAGSLASIRWNGESMYFESADEGREAAAAMTFFHWKEQPEPGSRVMLDFLKQDGRWHINDIPSMFPSEKKKKKQPVEGPGSS